MTVLSELRERRILVPSEEAGFPDSEGRLDENHWQDIHLAAADIHLRRRLARGEPLELPMRPSATDTAMGLLTSDCGIYCLGGLGAREHADMRFDVFLFTGDVIKAPPELPTDPEKFMQTLQGQAVLMSRGLEAIGISTRDRTLYLAVQPLIWASRAVVNFGPGSVGRPSVAEAMEQLAQRYMAGTTAYA
jgi:hypothetical protein